MFSIYISLEMLFLYLIMGKDEHSLSPYIWRWSLTTSHIEVSFLCSLKYKILNGGVDWRNDFALQQWTSSAIAIANTISVYEPVLRKYWGERRGGRGRDTAHDEVYSLQQFVIKLFAAGRWFSPGTSVSSTNKTDRHAWYNWHIVYSGVKQHNHSS